MEGTPDSINAYPVFKGLQKPLEFMGLRGRALPLAASTFGAAFLLFVVVNFLAGMWIALGAALIAAGIGLAVLYVKQRRGLHTKKRYRGLYIYHQLFKPLI